MVEHRGRKAPIHLVKTAVVPGQGRPEPPKDMPPDEAQVWTAIIASMPDAWFNTCFHVLRCLCVHVANAQAIATQLNAARESDDRKAFDKLMAMYGRETRMVLTHSQLLRLTPKARYTQERSTNLKALVPTSRPWEIRHHDK